MKTSLKKIMALSVLGLMSLTMMNANASSSYSRRVSSVNNAISNGISQLRQQMSMPGGMQNIYAQVGRSNDVFLFCKQGIPTDFWIGVDPTSGSYQITNYWYVNPQWIPYYVVVCPYGGKVPGNWNGPGDGSNVPFQH